MLQDGEAGTSGPPLKAFIFEVTEGYDHDLFAQFADMPITHTHTETRTHTPVLGLIGRLHCSYQTKSATAVSVCILRSVWKPILRQRATFSWFLSRILCVPYLRPYMTGERMNSSLTRTATRKVHLPAPPGAGRRCAWLHCSGQQMATTWKSYDVVKQAAFGSCLGGPQGQYGRHLDILGRV